MLNEKLYILRHYNGLKQWQIGKLLNVDRSTYSYYETGKTMPPANTMIRIAKFFNVSLDYLMLDQIDVLDFRKYPFHQ